MIYDSNTLRWVVDKVKTLEAASGMVSVNHATGSGNAITDLIKEGSGLTPNKGLTFSLSGHTHTFSSIADKPTTIGGYGITDAYTKTQTDSFLALKLDASTFNDLFEKVNIGTTASPVYAIKAKYNFYSVGEVSAFGASDIRLKSNIKPINSALGFLGKVKTYEFDWNEKALSLNPLKTKKGAGVIAQEMSLLDNNFVHSIYGEYLGVDYERFIPYLIGGVNEVADEVTILKKRVAELELEVKQLKK